MASATAREPSICLSIGRLQHFAGNVERLGGGGDILLGYSCGKLLSDRSEDRCESADGGDRLEPSEQRRIGHGAAYMLQRQLAVWKRAQPIALNPARQS